MRSWRCILTLAAVTVVLASCTNGEPGTSSRTYHFEGATDCSTDVTDDLNRFIAEVPDGGTISFAPDACYRIDGTVEVVDKQGLTFEGNNATFKALEQGDRNRQHWAFETGGGFTIRNLTVVGANPNGGADGYDADFAFQHGMNFSGVDGATITNIAITDVYGDFLRFGKNSGKDNRGTSNVTVTGSRFERGGRQAVSFTAASDIVIEGNTFDGVGRSVFDIEPNNSDGGAQRLRLADNDLSGWGNLVLPVGGRGEVADVALVGNRLHGKQLDVLIKDPREEQKGDGGGTRRRNISIVANVSDVPSSQTAVNLTMVDGAVVRDNVQRFDGGGSTVALKISQSCDVVVDGNDFQGAPVMVERDDYTCE